MEADYRCVIRSMTDLSTLTQEITMFGFKRRRRALIRSIANEVVSQLDNSKGRETFLPPVVLRDKIYMITKDGKIYSMFFDGASNMEVIMQIRR